MELAGKVASAERSDNALDVLVEIALFEPCDRFVAVRANNAGSKVIYTRADGSEVTYRAQDWTMAERRSNTATQLRARHALALSKGSEG
jgi:hypothetical protein